MTAECHSDQVLAALLARVEQLEGELAAVTASLHARDAAHAPQRVESSGAPISRRDVLRTLTAAVGGAGLAVAGSAVLAGPAAANSQGQSLTLGDPNNTATDATGVSATLTDIPTVRVTNAGTDGRTTGLYAISSASSGLSAFGAVVGDSNTEPGVIGLSSSNAAVLGIAHQRTGLRATGAVTGDSDTEPGVVGLTTRAVAGTLNSGLPAVMGVNTQLGPVVPVGGGYTNTSPPAGVVGTTDTALYGTVGANSAGTGVYGCAFGTGTRDDVPVGGVVGDTNRSSTPGVLGISHGRTGLRAVGAVTGDSDVSPGVVGLTTRAVAGTLDSGLPAVMGVNTQLGPLLPVGGGYASTSPPAGVVGTTDTALYGTVGANSVGTGVYGCAFASADKFGPAPVAGVVGETNNGNCPGVWGRNSVGIGVLAQGARAPLRLVPATATGAPTSGPHSAGELFVDAAGSVFVCTVGGTGTAAVWRRLAAAAPGFDNVSGKNAGVVNLLSSPIRIYDTRTGSAAPYPTTKAKLAAGSSFDLPVTGTTVGGIAVPAGAAGVIGTLTATNTADPGAGRAGYLTVFAQGISAPRVANLTWSAPAQTVSVLVVSALNMSNGQLTIANGAVGGSAATDVIFDATGFLF